jgi:S-adenosylmethionine hydrolase
MTRRHEVLVALLTDFGTSDPYVGVMKGVMATRCPDAHFIDITHEVSPQNVRHAAYLLHSAYRYFPRHTIFLVVVDPGVGTQRHPVAIQTDHGIYVGPDNGVFGPILEEVDSWQAVILWPSHDMSATFHGRDLFAPVAAELACGRSITELGSPTSTLERFSLPKAELIAPDKLQGEVLHIDHFGNIVTSLGTFKWQGPDLILNGLDQFIRAETSQVRIGNQVITSIRATYGEAHPGEFVALINSDRQLEIAVNQGNADRLIHARIGDPVEINFTSGSS